MSSSSDLYKNATDRFGKDDSIIGGFFKFITEGNVLNLMVATVMGRALTQLVDALSKDILVPIVGVIAKEDLSTHFTVIKPGLTGKTDYKDYEEALEDEAIAVKYGSVLQSTINFVLEAFLIYVLIKGYNKARKIAESGLLTGVF